jgi:hypothetical protein
MVGWRAVLCGVGLTLAGTLARAEPPCQARVVPELKGPDRDRFARWRKKQGDPNVDSEAFYRADIDNDGRPEIVSTDHQGSGSYLYMTIYRETDGAFHEVDAPPAPTGVSYDGGGWYGHDSSSFFGSKPEPLIQICGDVYMSFADGPMGAREGYVWKNGKTVRACDPAWTAFQAADFKAFYDHELYDFARNNLEDFLAACGPRLEAETRLRFLSDLAVTRYHLGDFGPCLDAVALAKKEPAFSGSGARQALEHNAQLCAQPTPAKVQRAWFSFDRKGELADFPREKVLATTVPPFGLDLRGTVRDELAGPDSGRRVTAHRYVTIWGCMAHDCPERAFLWVDLERGTSVFALNDFEAPGGGKRCFALGSRTLGRKDLPAAFTTAYEDWRDHEQPLEHDCAYFIDGRTAAVKVTVMRPPDRDAP